MHLLKVMNNRMPWGCRLVVIGLIACVAQVACAEPTSVTFGKRPSVVGDGLDQTIELETTMRTRKRQSSEVLEEQQRQTGREQRRQVTVGVIEAGRVIGAEVTFLQSKEHRDQIEVADPVVGKTYKCVRKQEELQVFTESGKIPPLDEYKVVAKAMESLGKPNPLADYLVGRQISLGEEITLPNEVAQQVFGLDERLGVVARFVLKLTKIESFEGRLTATFATEVEAVGSGSTQMRLVLAGPLMIECASSRVVSTDLSGPIGMLESRGSLGNTYQIDGTGRLQLKIASRYRDFARE